MILMNNVILDSNEDVPQYLCSRCGECSSLFSISLCSKHNRGCCWYFPKFTLYEIHNMDEVIEILNKLPLEHYEFPQLNAIKTINV